jgi:hypothetical protein
VAEEASEVRAAIAQDRQDLADTVQALAQKADVKARLHDAVARTSEDLHQKAGELGDRLRGSTPDDAHRAVGTVAQRVRERPTLVMLVGVFFLGVLVGRRRARRRAR